MKKLITFVLLICTLFMSNSFVLAETIYDFSDEAQEEFDRQESLRKEEIRQETSTEIKSGPQLKKVKKKEQQVKTYEQPQAVEPPNRVVKGSVILIPKGEQFEAMLQSSISSESLAENDTIAAVLSKDWVYNGKLIAPVGSVLYGRSTDVKKAGYLYANGKMAVTFDEVMTPSGERIRLTSNKVYIEVKGNRALKVAANVAIGAVSGVAMAAVYTLLSGGNVAHGIAIGAAVGATGGLVNAGFQRGENAEIKAGTVIIVRLVEPTEVVPYNDNYGMIEE